MISAVDDFFSRPAAKPEAKALSVTQLLRRMKNLIEIELGRVWVEGEVSNLKKQGSGHWYFSLKDAGAQIQCAMFSARKRSGHEALEDGAKVRVFAEASVYEARGQLQIIVQQVERAGLGDLHARFEALKQKLQAEGLFDAERKKPIPTFPHTIGLITSDTGAAIQDMLHVLERRAPWVQPVLFPVRVQGKGAEQEIARAIERMGQPEKFGLPVCDVLIVGRGGGSLEDLWNFNEEVVARAIAACPIPIISAVGHEIDFTIADFVADLRAPTPSAAAELAVPDGEELRQQLQQWRRRLARGVQGHLMQARHRLEQLKRGMAQYGGERALREPMLRCDALQARLLGAVKNRMEQNAALLKQAAARHRSSHPQKVLERRGERIDSLRKQLQRLTQEAVDRRQLQLKRVAGMLRTLGPESAFQRGFSITLDATGAIVRSTADVAPGEVLRTKLKDGEVRAKVISEK